MPTPDLPALLSAATAALPASGPARVIGERVRILSVEHAGDRRGLVARVERKGATHTLSLADVEVDPGSPLREVIERYRAFLGIDPAPAKLAPGSPPAGLSPGATVEAIVLSVKQNAARCRLAGGQVTFTLRCAGVYELVPGELAMLRLAKVWRHAGHPYASGEVARCQLSVDRLGLVPLGLARQGDWDPAEEDWGEQGTVPEWARPIVARGPRPAFELEQVLPGADPDDWEADPILEAVELREAGDVQGARTRLMELLDRDLRCLDAHAHLGNQEFELMPAKALRHYKAGVRIGELSLGPNFDGVLPWGLVDNRPFLRCLHGYGLTLWRLGRSDEAARVFERLLWLDPGDALGARFLLDEVRRGLAWQEHEEHEEEEANPYGDRPSRARPRSVPVDLEGLMFAFEDHDAGHDWYLDLETGQAFLVSDDDLLDDLPGGREDLEDESRYVYVEQEEPGRAYRDMEEFTEAVNDGALRTRLRDALAGKGAFGRFKRVLGDHPGVRDRWFEFRKRAARGAGPRVARGDRGEGGAEGRERCPGLTAIYKTVEYATHGEAQGNPDLRPNLRHHSRADGALRSPRRGQEGAPHRAGAPASPERPRGAACRVHRQAARRGLARDRR